MYLNSTTNKTVWDCIVWALGNKPKKGFTLLKHVKKTGNILDNNENFKILSWVFQTVTNKKSLEITYRRMPRIRTYI